MKNIYLGLALCISSLTLTAQNTAFDTSFGNEGIVLHTISAPTNYTESVAVQSDGKILIAGSAGEESDLKMAISRFNEDGSLDFDFGDNGNLLFNVGTGKSFIMDVKVQPDGKIVLAGYTWEINSGDFIVIRLNEDGSFDDTFGENGIIIVEDGSNEVAATMELLDDGRILIAGYSDDNFAMAMVNPDGSMDESFGNYGWVVTPFGTLWSYGRGIGIQEDGKIVLGGMVMNPGNYYEMGVVRYETDGSIDMSFGENGRLVFGIGTSNDFLERVRIQEDGKILLGGHTYSGTNPLKYDMAAVRLNTDGSFDDSFGENGISTAKVVSQENYVSDMLIQDDGKIILAGNTRESNLYYDAAMVRFNTDGTLDSSFGEEGKILFDIDGNVDEGTALALQEDGKIILGGLTYEINDDLMYMFLARFADETMNLVEVNSEEIRIYPNPVTDFVHFDLKDKSKEYTFEAYNTLGQKIQTGTINGQSKINVSNWTPGVYFLKINTGKETKVQKLIKR